MKIVWRMRYVMQRLKDVNATMILLAQMDCVVCEKNVNLILIIFCFGLSR